MSSTVDQPSRFELRKMLGEGGTGVVYEALDRERGVRVAVKMLRTVDAANLYRFKREFRTLAGVSHQNIVALYELVSEQDRWYLSMELIEGTDLLTFVCHPPPRVEEPSGLSSPFGPSEITADTRVLAGIPEIKPEFSSLVDELKLRTCLAQLASATHALHQSGLVHRDLKPSNTRVTSTGRLVLMDFGIAATENESSPIYSDSTAGTPAYMAPEQAAGERPTPSADWYAFGSIMYQALSGRLPFEGPRTQVLVEKQHREPRPLGDYVDGCPQDLAELCAALIARDPARRPTGEIVLRKLGGGDRERTYTTRGTDGGSFVGRDTTLARMLRAFRDVRSSGSRCVVVEGDVGLGKSALIERFAHEVVEIPPDPMQALASQTIVLSGRCHESESLAYRAFDDIIDGLTRHLLTLPDNVVADLLPRDADSLPRLFPVMRRIPAIRVAQPVGGLDASRQAARAFAALRKLFIVLAQRAPLVIAIDDMHWADSSSLELLQGIFSGPPIDGLCIVFTSRRDDDGNTLLKDCVERLFPADARLLLPLEPLSDDDQRMLVTVRAANEPFLVGYEEVVWSAGNGNPLFLNELIRFVSEHPSRLPEWVKLPPHERLTAALAARVEALADEPRRLLEVIALARSPLRVRVLARAAGIARDDAERAAAVLRVAGFAHADRGAADRPLVVNHPRVAETVLSLMSAAATQQLHRQLADELERWDDASAAVLAHHLLATGDKVRAVHYLCAAADHAHDKGDDARAVALLDAALAASDEETTRDIEARRGEILMSLGRASDAAVAFAHAATLSHDGREVEFLQLRAENLLGAGDITGGLSVFSAVLKSHGDALPRTRGAAVRRLLLSRARLWWHRGQNGSRDAADIPGRVLARIDSLYAASVALMMLDPLKGAAMQREHLAAAHSAGEPSRRRRASALDAVYRATKDRAAARASLSEFPALIEGARTADDLHTLAVALASRAAVETLAGLLDAAIESSAEATRVLNRHPRRYSWEQGANKYAHAMVLFSRGRFAEANNVVLEALADAERRHDRVIIASFGAVPRAYLALTEGSEAAQRAREQLDTLIETWSEEPYSLIQWRLRLADGMLAIGLGDLAGAQLRLAELLAGARRSGLVHIPLARAMVHHLGLQVAALAKDQRASERHATALLQTDMPMMIAAVDVARAGFALANEDRGKATRLTSIALDRVIESGALHFAAACRQALIRQEGGGAAEPLRSQVRDWAASQNIEDPSLLLRYLAPGLLSS